jgi:translation initiation factor IF-2
MAVKKTTDEVVVAKFYEVIKNILDNNGNPKNKQELDSLDLAIRMYKAVTTAGDGE